MLGIWVVEPVMTGTAEFEAKGKEKILSKS